MLLLCYKYIINMHNDNNLEGETDEKIEESEDENPIDENADKEVDNEENGF